MQKTGIQPLLAKTALPRHSRGCHSSLGPCANVNAVPRVNIPHSALSLLCTLSFPSSSFSLYVPQLPVCFPSLSMRLCRGTAGTNKMRAAGRKCEGLKASGKTHTHTHTHTHTRTRTHTHTHTWCRRQGVRARQLFPPAPAHPCQKVNARALLTQTFTAEQVYSH